MNASIALAKGLLAASFPWCLSRCRSSPSEVAAAAIEIGEPPRLFRNSPDIRSAPIHLVQPIEGLLDGYPVKNRDAGQSPCPLAMETQTRAFPNSCPS